MTEDTIVICDPYEAWHCYHWAYTYDACCYCGSKVDSDDDLCPGPTS